jgi:hypothetical protein
MIMFDMSMYFMAMAICIRTCDENYSSLCGLVGRKLGLLNGNNKWAGSTRE